MRKVFQRLTGLFLACFFLFSMGHAEMKTDSQKVEGIIYQVFVRAFADSDGDGIGDLQGVIQKLDYIESLGAKAIWLMPIHPSPSYHGYDVTDYQDINPEYGSLADFSQLLEAAHARGIGVLIDIPFNHTSVKHPWFIASQQADSPYRSWYHWVEEGQTQLDLNISVWNQKPWKKYGNAYYYAIFWDGMPDLNFNNPAVREEVLSIAKFWLSLGVDGFRLDATSHIYGEGETQRLQDTEASADFWVWLSEQIRQEYPNAYLLGEAWEPLSKRAELIRGLDSVVNFDVGDRLLPMLKSGGSGAAFVTMLEAVYEAYEASNPDYVDAPFLSNHDQNRVAASLVLKQDKMALAARILLTLPGNPIIYYGEEIGMVGAKPDEELRTPMLWGGDDPLQTSWRESRYNKKTIPVTQQLKDSQSLLSVYLEMTALRNGQPALFSGGFEKYDSENSIPLAFWRNHGKEQMLVLHNPSANSQQIAVPEGLHPIFATVGAENSDGTATLPGLGTLILSNQKENTP